MDWLEKYGDELALMFAEAEAEVAAFPAPLNRAGNALLARIKPDGSGGGTNYISFLLPYWYSEATGASGALCRDLAVGNVLAMLHFFLLDDVMDGDAGPAGMDRRAALALGQLCQARFRQRYAGHFPAGSPLWDLEARYLADWAAAVCGEAEQPADPYDPAGLARKSAPVKLCAAGLLLAAGEPGRIPAMETAVDLALATLQLSDDWADWRDDLGMPNASAFLTLVRRTCGETGAGEAERPPDERSVKRAVYRHDVLDRLAAIAEDYDRRLTALADAPPALCAFHRSLAAGLRRDAEAIREEIYRLAAGGGFSYYLSNSTG